MRLESFQCRWKVNSINIQEMILFQSYSLNKNLLSHYSRFRWFIIRVFCYKIRKKGIVIARKGNSKYHSSLTGFDFMQYDCYTNLLLWSDHESLLCNFFFALGWKKKELDLIAPRFEEYVPLQWSISSRSNSLMWVALCI